MLNANLRAINRDARNLVKDAQELFHAAATLTGEQADDARKRGLYLLDKALGQVQHGRASVIRAGQDMSVTATHMVQDNPWRTVAVVAGVGMLFGALLARSCSSSAAEH